MRKTLSHINPNKAAGLDRVFGGGAEALCRTTDSSVYQPVQAIVPLCLKAATIIPIPNQQSVLFLTHIKKNTVDFKKVRAVYSPLYIKGSEVDTIKNTKFLVFTW